MMMMAQVDPEEASFTHVCLLLKQTRMAEADTEDEVWRADSTKMLLHFGLQSSQHVTQTDRQQQKKSKPLLASTFSQWKHLSGLEKLQSWREGDFFNFR